MLFEIAYSDDETIERRVGNWEDLPDRDVQLVTLIQADGDRVVLSGFDRYYLAGLTWGGCYDEAGIWPMDGWRYELRPGAPARLVGARGGVPAGALVKYGRLVKDELAAELGLATDWRPWYEARKAGMV